MLERDGGGYNWSRDHNSKFETSKFALIDFSMNRTKTQPSMIVRGSTICPSATHKFLGVILDQELRWKEHVTYAIAKGTAYALQLCRLSSTATRMPMKLTRQLYQAVTIPKMLYAADVWFTPVYHTGSDTSQRGSQARSNRKDDLSTKDRGDRNNQSHENHCDRYT